MKWVDALLDLLLKQGRELWDDAALDTVTMRKFLRGMSKINSRNTTMGFRRKSL